VLKDHTNFVIATCYIPPNDRFLDGLIITGGNDKKICVYSAKQGIQLFILEGHDQAGKEIFFNHTHKIEFFFLYLKFHVYLMCHKVICY
jgi:WD40 repeat protein